MNTLHLIRKLWPFIRKYQGSLTLALLLTLCCGLLSLVTPLVMERTVNTVRQLQTLPVEDRRIWQQVGWLAALLLGNELLGLVLQLWQKYLSDGLRFRLAGDQIGRAHV